MIMSNTRFVKKIASTYIGSGDLLSDLISEGCIGLIKAVDKFDPSRNVRFASYAGIFIHQSCINYVKYNNSLIRTPRSNTLKNKKNKPYLAQFIDDETPIIHKNLSINSLLEDTACNREFIYDILKILTEDEKKIILDYYGINCATKSLRVLKQEHNCSHEQIRKRICKIIKKIKLYNNCNCDNAIYTKNKINIMPVSTQISVYISVSDHKLFGELCKKINRSRKDQLSIILNDFIDNKSTTTSILFQDKHSINYANYKYFSYWITQREIINIIKNIFIKENIKNGLGLGIGLLIINWIKLNNN